jgi:hypothetical protein
MKLIKHIKKILIVSMIAVMFMMVGCSNNSEQSNASGNNNANKNTAFQIPEAGATGGYEINSDAFYCIVAVDNDYKYSKFKSKSNNHTVEYYASPTEMVIIDIGEEGTKYYHAMFDDIDQIYTNPLKAVYDDLKGLEFNQVENEENAGQNVFQAIKTTQVVDQQQIDYTEYQIEMTWTDDEVYNFSYYEYVDGSILISAEAPDEINPLINKDTVWAVDMENKCVSNNETKKEVAFTVTGISTGKALSPNGTETTVKDVQSYVYVYVNKDNGLIEKMQYSDNEAADGMTVDILNSVEITKPEVTDDMVEMNEDELYVAMMLIGMLESLI